MKRAYSPLSIVLSCFVLHHGKCNVRQGAKMRRKWPVAAAAIPHISMPDTSVGDMASDGSFAVNYTGTGFAPWFGF